MPSTSVENPTQPAKIVIGSKRTPKLLTRSELEALVAKSEAAKKEAERQAESAKGEVEFATQEAERAKAIARNALEEVEFWKTEALKAKLGNENAKPQPRAPGKEKENGEPPNPGPVEVPPPKPVASLNPEVKPPGLEDPKIEKPTAPEETKPPSSYLCGSTIFPITDDTSSSNPAIFSSKRLWPNGQVIPYRFLDGHANQHAKVTKLIPEWGRYANITFTRSEDTSPPLLPLITISFKHRWGCWSYIGTDARTTTSNPEFTMMLGAVSEGPETTPSDRSIILHQFGHALGLVHEHMCPSETDAVALKQNLIIKHRSLRDHEASIGKHLNVYANSSVTNYAAPDLQSIMIYSMPGELNEGNLTVEPNTSLSQLDKAFMAINYPRARVHAQASEWTLRHALLIAKVDDKTTQAIIEEHDITTRRTLFADYFSAERQRRAAALVDPAPRNVYDLTLPVTQDALRRFFDDLASHPKAQEIFTDTELMEELKAVLNHLASDNAVREVVHQALPSRPLPAVPGSVVVDEPFVNRLLAVVATLHAAVDPSNPVDAGIRQANAATALFNELAHQETFRLAMKRAIGQDTPSSHPTPIPPTTPGVMPLQPINPKPDEDEDEKTEPDVSALVAKLSASPALLRAVQQALNPRG